jgi:hypothetical protein
MSTRSATPALMLNSVLTLRVARGQPALRSPAAAPPPRAPAPTLDYLTEGLT